MFICGGSDSKESTTKQRPRFNPWIRKGNGYPLQYSCLENSMNRGTRWATVKSVAESDTTEHSEKKK